MESTNNRALFLLVIIISIISFGSGFFISKSQTKPNSFDTTINVSHHYDSAVNHFSTRQVTYSNTDSVVYYPPSLDSLAILKIIERWFTHYQKSEVYRDQNLEATISDSIGENRIINRAFSYKILRPDSIVTIQLSSTQNKGNFYPGLSACYLGTEAKPSFGPAMFYTFNRVGIYAGAGVGERTTLNFGLHFKLKSK